MKRAKPMRHRRIKHTYHFVGIGGIGMSAIALILLKEGHSITGSDLKHTEITERLKKEGAEIFIGHKSSNVPERADKVVYSSSISVNNPEMRRAKDLNIECAHRSDMLALILNPKKGIAVSGAHGKTTTTTLISLIFKDAGEDPSILIGADAENLNTNAVYGRGEYVIAEADESDGSFTKLRSLFGVITNIDFEHIDYYKSIGAIKKANRVFAENIKKGGCLFYNSDDKNLRKLSKHIGRRKRTFGLYGDSDITAKGIMTNGQKTSFDCFYRGKKIFGATLSAPGWHNVYNALAAILVGLEAGIDASVIKKSIESYSGIKRRFELKGFVDGITVIEDYAHHPTEIEAVLKTAREIWQKGRIISVFQPHRYSRTLHLADEFAKSLSCADKIVLTDIYAAFERPIKNVSIKNIYESVKNDHKDKFVLCDKNRIAENLVKDIRQDDVVLVLGAGDINEVCLEIVEKLKKNS
jgi:UDP-N-acetylmuramate--alanine ligase